VCVIVSFSVCLSAAVITVAAITCKSRDKMNALVAVNTDVNVNLVIECTCSCEYRRECESRDKMNARVAVNTDVNVNLVIE